MNRVRSWWERLGLRGEESYLRALMKLVRQVGIFTETMQDDPERLSRTLNAYSVAILPWAEIVGEKMVRNVERMEMAAWRKQSREISKGLRKIVEETPTGEIFRKRMEAQVSLITSLPRDAAERVHKLTQQAVTGGWTQEYLRARIMETASVTESHARLIARTEAHRTAAELQRARAEWAGSTHYVWRAIRDKNTRHLHRELDGKTFAWNDPPVAGSNGERANPGCIYNCRCVAEPVFPNEQFSK